MRIGAVLGAALLVQAALPVSVWAADIARLEWGGFVVEEDSSGGWDGYRSVAADDGSSISLSFTSLDAKADGATAEDRALFAGRYEISQPPGERFDSLTATVEGFIIKSEPAVARLVLKVGPAEQVIEWNAGQSISEKFRKEIVIPVAAEGQLPTPLAVRIETFAQKGGGSDAAFVSVDSLVISTAATRIAGN